MLEIFMDVFRCWVSFNQDIGEWDVTNVKIWSMFNIGAGKMVQIL